MPPDFFGSPGWTLTSPGWTLTAIAGVAFLLSTAATPLLRRGATGVGLVAHPRSDRWHDRPTPVFGGVAIFLGFAAAFLLAQYWPGAAAFGGAPLWREGLILAAAFMFVAGLVDDVRSMSPVTKLLLQMVAAFMLIQSGVMLRLFGLPVVDAIVSVVWFVGITNALNLLDNMDGLAGGIAAIAAFYLGVIFVMDGHLPFALLAFALFGAVAGFLVHNWPPAKIFMGDSGSLFLGVFLAGLALAPSPGGSRGLFAVMALPVLLLAIPILDTTLVTAGRVAEGRPISQGGRDHLSHRLVALGLSGRRAVALLWLLAAASGGIGLLFRTSGAELAYLFGGLMIALLFVLAAHLFGVELRQPIGPGADSLARRFRAWHTRWPVLVMALDLILVASAYYAAYLIRWEAGERTAELVYFAESLPLVMAGKLTAFVLAGAYRHRWRHFGLADAGSLLRASVLGSLLVTALLLLVTGFGLSRGVLVIDFLVCTMLIVGARFSTRILDGAGRRWDESTRKALFVGPAEDALVVMAELGRRKGAEDYRVIAVLDPGGEDGRGTIRGRPLHRGSHQTRAWLRRHPLPAMVLTLRRDGDSDPAVVKLLEECAAAGAKLAAVDVGLRALEPGELAEGRGRTAS